MKFMICVLLTLASWQVWAKGGFFYTVFVKSGPNLVKLLVEKRADLTIGIVGGVIVTAADKSISPLFAEKAPGGLTPDDREALKRFRDSMNDLKNCTGLTGKIASCPGDVKLGKEEPAPDKVLKEASSVITGSMLTSEFNFPATSNAGKFKGRFSNLPLLSGIEAQPPAALPVPRTTLALSVPRPSASPGPSDRMMEMTFWMSVQNSAFIPDFEDYLRRYPNGEFRELAERRLAYLKSLPPPATQPAPLACAESEDAILAPVRFLYRAINNRDIRAYAQPWAQRATYRTYSNTVRMDKQDLFIDRRRAFERWRSVNVEMIGHRVLLDGPLGTATVRIYYDANIILGDGAPVHDQAYESYALVCEADGLWRIAESILYD